MSYFTEKETAQFRTAVVVVCWDMVGCPIPSGMNVVTVSNNIRGSVKKAGYQGHVEINAFGYSLPSAGDLLDAKVTMKVLTEGDEEERLQMILSHFLCRAVEFRKRVNLMLIVGDISRRSQFNFESAIKQLERLGYNCILAQPKYLPILEQRSITTTWLWDTLSTGGQALRRRLKFAATDDEDHTSLAVVDYTMSGMPRSMSYEFSVNYFEMGQTFVFWDFFGCPVPDGLPVNDAISNIEYSIRAKGCRNLMMPRSFVAYCDVSKVSDVLGNTEFLLPLRHAGTKEERRKKIFVDFMFKAIGHRQPLNLVLIMEDISEHPEILHALEFCKGRKNINILLSQPRLDKISKKLLGSVGTLWLWHSLCLAECPLTEEDIEGIEGEGSVEGIEGEGSVEGIEGEGSVVGIKGEGRRIRRRRQRKRKSEAAKSLRVSEYEYLQ